MVHASQTGSSIRRGRGAGNRMHLSTGMYLTTPAGGGGTVEATGTEMTS